MAEALRIAVIIFAFSLAVTAIGVLGVVIVKGDAACADGGAIAVLTGCPVQQ